MSRSHNEGLWDAFPLVLCVNLKERDDRFEEVKEEFRRVGLDRVTFYRTQRQGDGLKGCFDSHMDCLDHAVRAGVPYVLIFEDDVVFQDGYEECVRRSVEFLNSGRDWNLFYLGGFVLSKAGGHGKHLIRGALTCTHAYIVRTEYAKTMLARQWEHRSLPVDWYFILLNGNRSVAHVYPMPCIQRDSQSDIAWTGGPRTRPGWWGNAMIYTSLNFWDRMRFPQFTLYERIQLGNGLPVLRMYRLYLRLRVWWNRRRAAEVKARHEAAPAPAGEFVPVRLGEEAAI